MKYRWLTYIILIAVIVSVLALAVWLVGGYLSGETAGELKGPEDLKKLGDPDPTPEQGWGIVRLFVLIALATLLSEDLTCIGAGLLVVAGTIKFWVAVTAAFTGIFIGDSIIFFSGYFLGRPLLRKKPFCWILKESSVEWAQSLFERRGMAIIVLTRFLPGTRTATYFSAGAVHTSILPFMGLFVLAAAIWAPFLVGLTSFMGERLLDYYETWEAFAIPAFVLFALFMYFVFHYILPLLTWRGRRLMLSRWRRLVRWEFWPVWRFYIPVAAYVLWLGCVRYRQPALFTITNPGMPHSGLIGEDKGDILEKLDGETEEVPPWERIPASLSAGERFERVTAFCETHGIDYPVVLKPMEGQRGRGVKIVESAVEAQAWLEFNPGDWMVQAYVKGAEFGVLYFREPEWDRGKIFSLNYKEQIEVEGDGEAHLERLILRHERAVCQAELFLKRFQKRLTEIPEKGEKIVLGNLGTHALGAVFRDGTHLITPELEAAIDRIAQRYEGFYFGRFDIIAPSQEALMRGEGIRIIELNGVSSEAAHIYDSRYSVWYAWKTLFRQWALAFRIAEQNRKAGYVPMKAGALIKLAWSARKRQKAVR